MRILFFVLVNLSLDKGHVQKRFNEATHKLFAFRLSQIMFVIGYLISFWLFKIIRTEKR